MTQSSTVRLGPAGALRPDDRRRFPRPAGGSWVEALEGRQLFAVNPLQAIPLLPLPGGGGGQVQTDTTPPTARLTGNARDPSGLGHNIDITYTDDTLLADTSIDNSDIRVTGPGSFNELARLRFITFQANAIRVAHYQIPNPTVFGTYTVSMELQQVMDTSGNFVATGPLGTFVAGQRPGGGTVTPNFSPPDLTVVVGKTPTKAATLQPNTLSFRVSNLGNAPTPSRVRVKVFVSPDRTFESTDPLATDQTIPRFSGGETRNVTLRFPVPDVVSGNYYFIVDVDPEDEIAEKLETNNVAFSTVAIPISTPFIDLSPTILNEEDLPTSVVGGSPGSVLLRIANRGTAAFARTATISLFASADTNLDAGDAQIITLPSVPLKIPAAGHRDARVRFTYPAGILEGNYHIIARVDSDVSVLDADATNNTTATAITVLIRPPFIDLRPDSIGVIDGPLGIGTNRVDVTVSNQGNVPASGNLTIALSASAGTVTSPSDVPLGTVTRFVRIRNGGKLKLRISFLLPPTLLRGVYFLHATVDPDQQFSERDETNNTVSTINPFPTP